MHQAWRDLLFLHWPIPVAAVRGLIPETLEIDAFEGRAYVGLIPFRMTGIRPVGLPPLPGLSRFEEVNVRTYVQRGDGRDRGVWFFSLDAAHRLAVAVARRTYHLPYHHARMRLARAEGPGAADGGAITYTSTRLGPGPRPAACELAYTPTGPARPAEPGTLEHFLVERYILYTRGPRGLLSGRVHHAPYQIQGATVHRLEESLVAAAGIARPETAPLAHYCQGVHVRIEAPRTLGA